MAWYFSMCPVVSQCPPFYSSRVHTWCGTNTIVGCLKMNFSAPCKMSQGAATAWRHSGHPFLMWSSFFERLAVGLGMFPRVWVSKPSPIPCLSWTYNLKGFCELGSPSVGAKTSFSFKVSNATCPSLVHLKGSESSPFKELYVVLLWVQSLEFKFGRTP